MGYYFFVIVILREKYITKYFYNLTIFKDGKLLLLDAVPSSEYSKIES